MELYNALLTLQYLCIAVLFIECWIVLKGYTHPIHGYLFFSCVATLINSLGYLFELKARSEEAYITALQMSYAGRIWIALALFIFVMKLCRIKTPAFLMETLVLIHMGIYASILTLKSNHLYYTDMRFAPEDGFPRLYHGNGILHHILMILQIIYIILGIAALIQRYRKEKRRIARKRLLFVIAAILAEASFYLIESTNLLKIYDVTMPGFLLSTLLMYIAIFGYDLLGARDIAREFMIDRLTEGIITIDNEGEIQYCNDQALRLFPTLMDDPDTVLSEIRAAILDGGPLFINDRIYSPEENNLLNKGKILGKLYVFTDSTERFQELLTDPVTGFYHRNGVEFYSGRMYEKVLEDKKALFLCVADMNGLKHINDTFGHECGDEALKELSRIIRDVLTEDDMAFRTGGDEFLIIGERATTEGVVREFTEKMENAIQTRNASLSLPYLVDMSYGPTAVFPDGHENELQELIKASDAIMYEMKKTRDPHKR